jgi:IS605 OrfB family transposase
VRFACSADALETLTRYRQGESDLLHRDGKWLLIATCDVPETRFARDVNHCIAKKIVTEAERTSRGIALEDLGGIRDRARLRKPQRVTLSSWAFAQLGSFIGYKARRAGVPVVYVDPGMDVTHVRGLRSRKPAQPRLASTVHLPGLRRRCAR